jgi:hypothetical protein
MQTHQINRTRRAFVTIATLCSMAMLSRGAELHRMVVVGIPISNTAQNVIPTEAEQMRQ